MVVVVVSLVVVDNNRLTRQAKAGRRPEDLHPVSGEGGRATAGLIYLHSIVHMNKYSIPQSGKDKPKRPKETT